MDRQVVKLAEETLTRYKALTEELSDPNIYSDGRRYTQVAKEHARLRHGAQMSQELLDAIEEAQEVEVEISPNDLEVDVYRSSGPGGQSVNTTDSAVRITHKPTGLVVTCQDEKSQLQNRDKAMRILRARLLQAEQERQANELSSARRAQVGGGGRSEKIRTYNFKENRVTDHRVGLTVHKLDQVLAGDLDQLLDALVEADRAAQLAGVSN